jgi:microcystin degradation protein MlrC
MKRMFVASLATETNTFSPIPTGPNVWSAQVLVHAGDLGALAGDMMAIPYERADTSRLWPFVENPFANP